MDEDRATDGLLQEQIAYYRAVATEYETHAIAGWGEEQVVAALEAFAPTGDVLELACGPGSWTELLLRSASSVTAVDASPEMLARTRARVGQGRVQLIQADLFSWRPARRYDLVFFGFWLSHVPRERFDAFWSLLAECLTTDGRVFFVDDALRTPEELIEGEESSTIERRLNDGTAYRAVKVPYTPTELEQRLRALGWQIQVRQTTGHFYWGSGCRAPGG